MSISRSITLTTISIIALVVILLVLQLILYKVKRKGDDQGKLKSSYGVWFVSLFVAGVINMVKAFTVLSEAIDIIYKTNLTNKVWEVAKTASLFIGLSAMWFLIWLYVSNLLSIPILGKRKDQNEIDVNNVSYFLIKGILIIGFIVCLIPAFETILRNFMPSVQLPFYH